MNIPDTNLFPVAEYRLPAPDAGPLDLKARLVAQVEWDIAPELVFEEFPAVKVWIRLFEAHDGQVVYCSIHLDPSGKVTYYNLAVRPSLHEFFEAKYDLDVHVTHKEMLLEAMRRQAGTAQ